MRVTREAQLKSDARRISKMMERSGLKRVAINGKRADWLVSSYGSLPELAKFASDEAKYEGKLR